MMLAKLVETVSSYLTYERTVLEKLTQMRTSIYEFSIK